MSQQHIDISKDILRGCIKQKAKSQEALYKHYYSYAKSICLRYAANRDEAVDIMNDAFIKVFHSIKTYDKKNPFKLWLRAIIINTAIDYYRANIYKQHIRYTSTNDFDIATEAINDLVIEDIRLILSGLPEIQRLIFNLYEIEGYSHKEISEKLQIAQATSSSYLSLAKKNIRERYLKYNGEVVQNELITA